MPGICVGSGGCRIDIDDQGFCDETKGQACSLGPAVAVVANTNRSSSASTRTISVHGICVGDPVVVNGLFNVVITGDPPAGSPPGSCPEKGPATFSLSSTIARKPPPFAIPSGSNGELLKIRKSSRVTVKYLNIRDGRHPQHSDDGVDLKTSTGSRLFCNCVTNNEDALDMDAGSCNQIVQNLVIANENGIRASGGTTFGLVQDNTVTDNNLPIIDAPSDPAGRHNGLIISEASASNNFIGNISTGNPDDGFKIDVASNNCVVNNSIMNNGGDPNASVPRDTGGCELVSATNNRIDCNPISGNITKTSQPSDVCRLISGSGNTGCNVPPPTPCPPPTCTCPALRCSVQPIP